MLILFKANLAGAFADLRDEEELLDVTLVSEGRFLRAHRLVLSACSPLLRDMLSSRPQDRRAGYSCGSQPGMIFLHNVRYRDAVAILNFMYQGEVNVNQEDLQAFLAAAEDLRIRGLSDRGGGGGAKETSSSNATSSSKKRGGSSSPPPAKAKRLSPDDKDERELSSKRRMVVTPDVPSGYPDGEGGRGGGGEEGGHDMYGDDPYGYHRGQRDFDDEDGPNGMPGMSA